MCTKPLNVVSVLAGVVVWAIASSYACAQPVVINPMIMRPGIGGALPGGRIMLPYQFTDGAGSMWQIFNDGALRQAMGQAAYIQGGMVTVDGANFVAMNNQATVDAKTGEIVLEGNPNNGAGMGISVARHIFLDKENNYVRYIDVFHNITQQERTTAVTVQTVLNFGVQQSQMVPDPKHLDVNIAWSGMTGTGRAVLEVYAGSEGKIAPQINFQNGGNVIAANYSLTIPAGQSMALAHLHLFVPSIDAGVKFSTDLRAAKLFRNVPAEIRRQIVNFDAGNGWLADLEILRGDIFDIVELRDGDQYKGTLQESTYKLDTFYGPIALPSDRVVALLVAAPNQAADTSRELVVAADGEIFGGTLSKPTVDIALTSGQTVSIPLEQIARVGYRKRVNEPDEFTFEKPLVLMRGGDRVVVRPPTSKIAVTTPYGRLMLDPAAVAAIAFVPDEPNPPADSNVYDIYLTDGSQIRGTLADQTLSMQLDGIGPAQSVTFPVIAMARLQLTAKVPDADSDGPSLSLVTQDLLCGSLENEVKLQTSFDTITLDGRQIRKIIRAAGHKSDRSSAAGASGVPSTWPSPAAVQITLWDGSTMTGQITETAVQCELLSGAMVSVPAGMIKEYNQPHPLPSTDMVRQIQAAAADLGADDWRQRDRAEATLTAMGPAVIGVLREVRAKMDPEAQQRIDSIIKALSEQSATPANGLQRTFLGGQ